VALISLAMLLGRAGRREQVRRVLRRSIRLARRVGSSRSLAFALSNLGMLEHSLGEPAGPTFERALSAVARSRDPRAEAHIHRAWGHWAFESGDPVSGRRHLEISLEMGERLQLDGLAPLCRALLAWLELDLGHVDQAEALLDAADQDLDGSTRRDVAAHAALVRAAWAWCGGRLDDGDARFARARVELEALGCRKDSLLDATACRIQARFRPVALRS
jgi:tetratricopeptide (TPR) repeat protein